MLYMVRVGQSRVVRVLNFNAESCRCEFHSGLDWKTFTVNQTVHVNQSIVIGKVSGGEMKVFEKGFFHMPLPKIRYASNITQTCPCIIHHYYINTSVTQYVIAMF